MISFDEVPKDEWVRINLDSVQTFSAGGAFQIAGRPRVSRVLIEYCKKVNVLKTREEIEQYEEAMLKVVQWLDDGITVEVMTKEGLVF